MTHAFFVINRLLMFLIGIGCIAAAATAAVLGRPAPVLFGLALFAVIAISYSRFQDLPPWLQRSLGIVSNASAFLVPLHAFSLDWHTHGPSVEAVLAPVAFGLLFGVPLVQLLRGRTPPTLVWRGRA